MPSPRQKRHFWHKSSDPSAILMSRRATPPSTPKLCGVARERDSNGVDSAARGPRPRRAPRPRPRGARRPPNLAQWLNSTLPQPGTSLRDELKCYTLPFGTIGFASHLLTYCPVIMLGLGRSPWLLRPLKYGNADTALAAASMTRTLFLTVLAMVRCRGEWQLALLAFWKLAMSLTLGVTSMHASILVARSAAGMPAPEGMLRSIWRLAKAVGGGGRWSRTATIWFFTGCILPLNDCRSCRSDATYYVRLLYCAEMRYDIKHYG
jgi:hypothetical protein